MTERQMGRQRTEEASRLRAKRFSSGTTPELAVGFLLTRFLPATLLLARLGVLALLLTGLLIGVLGLLARLVVLVLLVLATHSETPLLNSAKTNSLVSALVARELQFPRRLLRGEAAATV
jgi:hypothetical protein